MTKRAENVPPTEVTLRSKSHAARIDLSLPLYHRRLRPSPRKLNKTLSSSVLASLAKSKASLAYCQN